MKKLLSMMMAAAMMMSLVACGGNTATNNTTGNTTNDTTTTDSTNSGATVIKLGGIGPTTGDAAVYGLATQYGAQVAVDEINALGGDIQFELNFQDDTAVAETAVSAYNTLKDWGMDILYGCTTSGSCIAIAAETNADRYFQLTPSGSSTDITAGKDNVFQMCFTDPNQGVTAADYIKENGLGTKIGVIYNNGDAYSTGIAQGFIAHAAEIGLEVVSEQTFPSDDNTDYSVQLTACKDAGADLLFMPVYYTPASMILAQADQMSYAPVFFGGDGMDGILAIEGFDTSLAEGLLLMTPFNADSDDPAVVNFVEAFMELSGGEKPNQFAADGYDCVYAIYQALQNIEGAGDMAPQVLCDEMIAQFTSPDFVMDGLTGSGMTWGTNGEVSKAAQVFAVENGVYVQK